MIVTPLPNNRVSIEYTMAEFDAVIEAARGRFEREARTIYKAAPPKRKSGKARTR